MDLLVVNVNFRSRGIPYGVNKVITWYVFYMKKNKKQFFLIFYLRNFTIFPWKKFDDSGNFARLCKESSIASSVFFVSIFSWKFP
jgi:hypothetical protein